MTTPAGILAERALFALMLRHLVSTWDAAHLGPDAGLHARLYDHMRAAVSDARATLAEAGEDGTVWDVERRGGR